MKSCRVLKRIFFLLSGFFLVVFSAIELLQNFSISSRVDYFLKVAHSYINSYIGFITVLIIGIILFIFFIIMRNKKLLFSQTDFGDFTISTDALVDMVSQSIDNYKDIKCQNIHITPKDNNIFISATIELATGSDIPYTVTMLQKTINNYIQKCTGLTVSNIKIKVKPIKESTAKVYTSEEKQMEVIKDKKEDNTVNKVEPHSETENKQEEDNKSIE